MTFARRATRPATNAPGGVRAGGGGASNSVQGASNTVRGASNTVRGASTAAPEATATRDVASAPALPEPPDLAPLRAPRDGVPPLIDSPRALAEYAEALAAGSGPVAVDAERASSYRYGQRVYLVQLRREGAGTGLIDPIALGGDLSLIDEALRGVEWVLHAADQDLPSLREAGMTPDALFDTELAARLLGRSRVGLAAVVADDLGLELAKEHSASDWSERPLPHDWLVYAALDVELLIPLRALLGEQLAEAGKAAWAAQEFEHVRTAPPKPAPAEPWRKLPRLSSEVRTPRGLAVARSLWAARDDLAKRRDRSPTRVLPSASIVAAARALPRTAGELAALPEFSGRGTRPHVPYWFDAVARGLDLPEVELPSRRAPREPGAVPQPRAWWTLKPIASERLDAVHAVVRPMAERLQMPQENLLQPAAQKALAWQAAGQGPTQESAVADQLREFGARPWQVELLAEPLAGALSAVELNPGAGEPAGADRDRRPPRRSRRRPEKPERRSR